MTQAFQSLPGVSRLAAAERLGGAIGHTVLHVPSIDSTNLAMLRLAEEGLAHGTVLLADHQTSGRGKGERVWHSTPGAGLCFSLLLRAPYALETLPQITLVIAVAVAEAIATTTGVSPQIKWPNDLLVNGRKVCGILTELRLTPSDEVDWIVAGIGLNINDGADMFPEVLSNLASSLSVEAGHGLDRIAVFKSILGSMDTWINRWCSQGFAPVREAWVRRAHTLGKTITLELDKASVTGQAIDLGEDGCLLIRDKSGEIQAFYSGETPVPGKSGAASEF